MTEADRSGDRHGAAGAAGVEIAPVFPVLDALRAVGALGVLTTHVGFYAGVYGHGTWGAFLSRLDVGVALFFVLSGFLLSRPYLARAAVGLPRPATGRYLRKRFWRIAPVYAIAVVAGLALLEENADLGPRDWAVTLSMASTFVDPQLPAGLSQMWSLGVEVTFYLVLPLLMLAVTGRRRTLGPARVVALLVAMVAVSVWWHLDGAAAASGLGDGQPLQWLPGYLAWFGAGIGLALAHVLVQRAGTPSAHHDRATRLAAAVLRLGREPGVCWAAVAGLMLVATTPLAGPVLLAPATPAQSLFKSLLYAVVGGLVVLSGIGAGDAAARADGPFARVLSAPLARHLGFTSYSLFCVHLLLLDLIAPALGFGLFQGHFWTLWALTVVASVAVADIAYRFVERPAMRLVDLRLPRRPRRPGTSGASGASVSGSATSGTRQR